MLTLHLGCGKRYLKDAVNIDVAGVLAKDNPDLVAQNSVTWGNYYPEPLDEAMRMSCTHEVVADIVDDARYLMSQEIGSVDRIVAIQVLEHLKPYDVSLALERWYALLKPGGEIFLSVPDMVGTAKLLIDAHNADDPHKMDFCLRHIYGRQEDQYSCHYAGYTKDKLAWLLFRAGFRRVDDYPSIHAYPAIMLRVVK